MKNNLIRQVVFAILYFAAILTYAQTVPFSFLEANFGAGKSIEWETSGYGNGYGHKIYNHDPGGLTLLNFAVRNNNASWTDAMSITSQGKIGIGTTVPLAKLHVEGTTHLFGDVTTTANTWIFNNNSDNNATIWLTKPTSGPSTVGHYYIKTFDWWGAFLHFQGTGDNGTERLNVTFDGKVGIGTTSPGRLLQVNNSSTTSYISVVSSDATIAGILFGDQTSDAVGRVTYNNADNAMRFYSNNSEKMQIDSDGNVGIGTTAPSEKLHVNGKVVLGSEPSPRWNNSLSSYVVESTHFYGHTNSQLIYVGESGNTVSLRGNVGIGTTTPTEKLEVNGTIRSKEVKVEASPWPDYVFETDYKLPSLEAIEKFVQSNGHLPEVPSAKEVEENGIALGEMNALLLKKIEELTLYMIDMKKENKAIKAELKALKNEK